MLWSDQSSGHNSTLRRGGLRDFLQLLRINACHSLSRLRLHTARTEIGARTKIPCPLFGSNTKICIYKERKTEKPAHSPLTLLNGDLGNLSHKMTDLSTHCATQPEWEESITVEVALIIFSAPHPPPHPHAPFHPTPAPAPYFIEQTSCFRRQF